MIIDFDLYFNDVHCAETGALGLDLWYDREVHVSLISLLIIDSNSLRVVQLVLGQQNICTEFFVSKV